MNSSPNLRPQVIRFADFDMDPLAGELRKHGTRVKLQIQPFQVLQILLQHAGEVVTREELQKKIWPADTFVDFDQGLNNAVRKLREALGDDADKPRFIETLAKRGYRFIGSVEAGNGSRAAAPATVATIDSVVVLPFTNLSTDAEDEFFADGITEEIINALAQIEQLHVVARSSAFSFKGKHIDPRVIGEQLNVRTVLEGSVRRSDNRLRITVQLINAANGYHLWSERYDREMKDIFDMQDEIARSVAERLKITLWPWPNKIGAPMALRPLANASRRLIRSVLSRLKTTRVPEIKDANEIHLLRVDGRLTKPGTTNLEAYELYLKGRVLLARRVPTIEYLDCFERAVKVDPNYALAWAGLADSYTVLGYSGLAHPQTCMPKAMEAARRAKALDPVLAEARAALAMASLMGAWDRVEARWQFLRSLMLNPRYLQARAWYALFYLMLSEGRSAEAIAEAKQALGSDPLSSYAHLMYGFICGLAGECAEAVQASRHAVELDPESYLARYILQTVLYLSGRFEESVVIGESALAMSDRHHWAMMQLGVTLADWGKAAAADAVYAEMSGRARHQYVPPAALALVAAATLREYETICHAQAAFDIHDPHCLFFFSKHAPTITARLYAYPRFREMLARNGRSDWLRD